MSLINVIRADLASAKSEKPARVAEATLLSLLLSELTNSVAATKYNEGAKPIRKQAEVEKWPLGQLEQARKDTIAFFKPLRAAALEKVQADYAGRGEQVVLDAINVVNDEFAAMEGSAIAAAEQQAEAEGWPLGRLEQALYDLAQKAKEDPTDEEVIEVVRNFYKGAQASAIALEKRGDKAGAEKALMEAALLGTYLPAAPTPLTEDELRGVIAAFKAAKADAKIGEIMAYLKTHHAGRFDGKLASQIANGG
ncbi:hypothetical protein CcrC1_gp072c [Caulobacter phage C1]|nr:hypothetical protein CcrC1_gp072c [Caulobacter phage C1]UTU08299.1 hypothetical protein CcrC2_gp071c [Caulobacter phage C2]UTU08822.1 hypothetical protein CcrJ4_gp071c [Caulobacter phage J4]UTU09374.1 hypothetical protein CcrBL47_gp088c [Caulobacter phage BL47]UTU09934.1 hypothetical protein CcrRB23_gp072c [Caulobacter phage RB23]WGN96959.1 hypothetical protein [Bertelyvirus sp.]